MTLTEEHAESLSPPSEGRDRPKTTAARLRLWIKAHRASISILVPLLTIVTLVNGWNFQGYPGSVNDDEGTYVDQAWALVYTGHLAHYTYWYDHPPVGWLQIAGYAWLTNGFNRTSLAILMGREVMLLATIAGSMLLYLIVRRLQYSRTAATIAVLLFTVSPLAVYYHRMVFLDNLQVLWMFAAMALVVSPRRSFGSAIGAGFCLAISTLSKETGGIMLPVIFWMLWQNLPRGRRATNLAAFLVSYISFSGFYVLYAELKGELFPGPGHVSLLHSLLWQMFGRSSSGSPLSKGGETYSLVEFWMSQDHWMLLAAVVMMIPGFCFRRTRPFALGYAVQIVLMFKGGYVPKAYAIELIPFAALLLACASNDLLTRSKPLRARTVPRLHLKRAWYAIRAMVVLALICSFVVGAAPQWKQSLKVEETRDSTIFLRQVQAWMQQHIPKNAHIVLDDNLWLDARNMGYTKIDWLYKVDLDPAVKINYPDAYNSVDYVIIDRLPDTLLRGLPTVFDAINHSQKVFTAGNDDVLYTVYKVDHPEWYHRK